MNILSKLGKFKRDQRGATIIEYAFFAGLVGLALIGAVSNLADSEDAMFEHVSSNFTKSVDGSL